MSHALEEAFGRPTTTEGQGGSIPLCNVLHDTFPDAEIMLLGVEEPRCLIHAPNESVDPKEIERMARRRGAVPGRIPGGALRIVAVARARSNRSCKQLRPSENAERAEERGKRM